MPARHRPPPRRAGPRRLLSTSAPTPRYDRRTLWFLAAPLVVLQVASFVGDALSPTLLVDAPLVLLALNARLRNLVLVAPTVEVVPFVVIAFIRLVGADPLFFRFGRRYGDEGIRWVDGQMGGARSVRVLERAFRRASYPVVAIAPNNLVCILAGATGMGWGPFLVLNISGTVVRLILVRLFTDFFAEDILGVVDWIGGNRAWLTVLTVLVVSVVVLRGRRGRGDRRGRRPEVRRSDSIGSAAMADDYEIPPPEPKEIDEKLSLEFRHLQERATLRGEPYGEERCDNCLYYLDPTEKISYCWHQQLRILVGGDWWCQWWEAIPEDA